MNYDITFCSYRRCRKECKRNQRNIDKLEWKIRGGMWIGDFPNCPHFKKSGGDKVE